MCIDAALICGNIGDGRVNNTSAHGLASVLSCVIWGKAVVTKIEEADMAKDSSEATSTEIIAIICKLSLDFQSSISLG
jgi:hypothetical protein